MAKDEELEEEEDEDAKSKSKSILQQKFPSTAAKILRMLIPFASHSIGYSTIYLPGIFALVSFDGVLV